MRKLRSLWIRLLSISGLKRRGDDIDAELESHLEMHIDDNVRSGMSREEARRRALIQLGGVEQTRQAVRERRTLPGLETLLQDARWPAADGAQSRIYGSSCVNAGYRHLRLRHGVHLDRCGSAGTVERGYRPERLVDAGDSDSERRVGAQLISRLSLIFAITLKLLQTALQ